MQYFGNLNLNVRYRSIILSGGIRYSIKEGPSRYYSTINLCSPVS